VRRFKSFAHRAHCDCAAAGGHDATDDTDDTDDTDANTYVLGRGL